jgi:hypothetical protein
MHHLFEAIKIIYETFLEMPIANRVLLIAVMVLILAVLIDSIIVIPISYYTTGRKFDRLLGKDDAPIFAALSGLSLFGSAGRHYFYQWAILSPEIRKRRFYQELYGDFDFTVYATPRDIRIAKIRWRVEGTAFYAFIVGLIAMGWPKFIAFLAKF